jgi:hypothetical protein
MTATDFAVRGDRRVTAAANPARHFWLNTPEIAMAAGLDDLHALVMDIIEAA